MWSPRGLVSGLVLRRFHFAGRLELWVVGLSLPRLSWASSRRGDSFRRSRSHRIPSPPSRRHAGSLAAHLPTRDRNLGLWVSSSLGVPQRSPLHRYPRVRPRSVSRGSGLPHPNAFRPCRSSRLRRLPPHTACRFVAPCYRSWGSPGFRPATDVRRCATLLRGVLPFEALRQDSGAPVARSPSSASLVHGDRSHRFPRPRGFVPSRSSTRSVLPRPEHELPWVSLDPGFHQTPPSPEGSRRIVEIRRARCWYTGLCFSPTQRPLCTARAPSRSHPRGWEPWRSRREPGFPRFR